MPNSEQVTVTIPKSQADFIQWIDDFNPNELYLSVHHTLESGIANWHWPEDDNTMPSDMLLGSWYNTMQLLRRLHDLSIATAKKRK